MHKQSSSEERRDDTQNLSGGMIFEGSTSSIGAGNKIENNGYLSI